MLEYPHDRLSLRPLKKLEKKIILNVNGVGYLVTVPATTLFTSKRVRISSSIFTPRFAKMILVSMDYHPQTQLSFNQLISVQGIGQNGDRYDVTMTDNIKNAIIHGDTATLTSIQALVKKSLNAPLQNSKTRSKWSVRAPFHNMRRAHSA